MARCSSKTTKEVMEHADRAVKQTNEEISRVKCYADTFRLDPLCFKITAATKNDGVQCNP